MRGKKWTEEESKQMYGRVKALVDQGEKVEAAMRTVGMHASHYYRVARKQKTKRPKSVETAQRIDLNYESPVLPDLVSEQAHAQIIVIRGTTRAIAQVIASLK